MSLRARLLPAALTLLSAVAVIGLGSVAVVTQLDAGDRVQQAQRADRDSLQRALSGLVEQYVNGTLLATSTQADTVAWTGTGKDTAALQHLVTTSPLTHYGAALLDRRGRPVAAWPSADALPATTDPGYAALRRTGVSDVMTVGSAAVVGFAVPVRTGTLVAFADTRTWALQGYHRELRVGDGAVPFVVDGRGVVAASGDESRIGHPSGLPLPTATTQVGDEIISTGDAGRGWHAITVQDAQSFAPGLDESRDRSLLALAALLTVVVVLLVGVHHRQRQTQERLAEQRLYDPLTGLAQRRLFDIRLQAALARQRRSGEPLALLYLDLDGFKDVNDTYGHNTGDHLLRVVADRLRTTVREDDFVVRLGGDEFAIILEGTEDTGLLVRRILQAVEQPVARGAHTLHPRLSVGGSLTRSGCTADELVHSADLAMYAFKSGQVGDPVLTDLDGTSALPLPLPRGAKESCS